MKALAKEPVIPVLPLAAEQIELVIPRGDLGAAGIDPGLDEADHTGTVAAAVAEVSDEDDAASLRMLPMSVVPQPGDQSLECLAFAVNISNDVQRAIYERLN
jgi:hypothetical protein